MHQFVKIASAFTTEDLALSTALSLLKNYFICSTNLQQMQPSESTVVLLLILKGLPPNNEVTGWWTEVHYILEQASQRLLGNTDDRSFRYNTRKSFYLTLSEPVTIKVLDRKPFEFIFAEIAKILEEMNMKRLVSNVNLN